MTPFPLTTIDIHPHVIARDTRCYPIAPLGGRQSDWSRDRPVTYEEMIVAMDQAGVQKAALVQAATCYGYDNSYLADAVAAHPERFTGVFTVDVLAPDAPEKIQYWLRRGLTGMRIFTAGSTMSVQADIDDPRSFPAWERAGELGVSVCMQMTAKAIPQLIGLIERFPNVPIVLDQLAQPVIEDGPPYTAAADLFNLARYGNVYLKVTPSTLIASRQGKATPLSFLTRLVEEFGASRIAWGSAYPQTGGTLAELLSLSRECLAVLPAQDREWIFAKTAQTLYPVLAKH